jgi:hypothetical protein
LAFISYNICVLLRAIHRQYDMRLGCGVYTK